MCVGRSSTTCATAWARQPRSRKSAIADAAHAAAGDTGDAGAGPALKDLSKQARGAWGERKAAAWYLDAGYEILEQNWRSSSGEIDLVLWRDGVIVFCEVKARRSERFGAASEAVDWRKQRKLRALAAQWLAASGRRGEVRFDVVTVTGVNIEVIEAAF